MYIFPETSITPSITPQWHEIAKLKSTLKTAMFSRPRRNAMYNRWISLDRKASLALSDPRTPAELATLRQKMLRLEEALRLDPYEAGTRAQREWGRFVAAWEVALGALVTSGRAEILP